MGSCLASNIPTGSPTSSPSSSLCFNEAPGKFWKALELKAVHPIQTAASSSVPASSDQTLLSLLHAASRTEDGPMISTDVTTRRQQKRSDLVSFWCDSLWIWSTGNTFYALSDLEPHILFRSRITSWPKVSQYKIQEIDNLSNPVVMTKRSICSHTACLCILLLSWPCVMSTLSVQLRRLLIGPQCGIVLDQSCRKCLGTLLPSVRGDGEQNRSPRGGRRRPCWVPNMQRSPNSYWARAKYDWHRAAITLDSRAAGETRYLFAGR